MEEARDAGWTGEPKSRGLARRHFVVAILLIALAVLVMFISAFFSAFTCAADGARCARSTEKNGVYEGTVVTKDRMPYRRGVVLVEFASRSSVDEPRVAFKTDRTGRICILWADELIYPSLSAPDGTPLFSYYRGFGYEGPAAALGGWQDLEGRQPPLGCQDSGAGIPWYRAEEASSRWQSWLLLALPFASILILLLAMILHRVPTSRRLVLAGSLLLVADAIAFLVLWGLI